VIRLMEKSICPPWAFCMEKLKTKTLWIIAITSGLCVAFSFVIATPIGMLADKILLARFAEQWTQSHDPDSVWSSMAVAEDIFAFTTYLIAFIALVCGTFAAWALYKRRRSKI